MTTRVTLKRPIPTSATLTKRELLLRSMRELKPIQPGEANPIGLVYGNSKTGRTGSKFKTVFVWNTPAVITCPGASAMCLRYCYNGDERKDVFPIEAWNKNLAWFRKDPDRLASAIRIQLAEAEGPRAVRIHSSGDFFSAHYILFWRKIAQANPDTIFWAYTRSWRVPELLAELEQFRQMPNVELFASWDASMDSPPPGWRLSIVTDNHAEWDNGSLDKKKMFLCPEQFGAVSNCASCGLCMKRDEKNILFTLH